MGQKAERMCCYSVDIDDISEAALDAIYGKGKRPSDELVQPESVRTEQSLTGDQCGADYIGAVDFSQACSDNVIFESACHRSPCPECCGNGKIYVLGGSGKYAQEVICGECGGSGVVFSLDGMDAFRRAVELGNRK